MLGKRKVDMDFSLAAAQAIEEENIEKLKKLYASSAEYFKISSGSDLRHAAACNSLASIRLLVSLGVDINGLEDNDTPLSDAALMGAESAVSVLIELGADIDFHNGAALFSAAYSGNLNIVRILLSHGGSVEGWDDGSISRSARDVAMQMGHHDLALWLKEQGCPTFLSPSSNSDVVRHLGGENAWTVHSDTEDVAVHIVALAKDTVIVTEGLSSIPQKMEDGSIRHVELMLRVPSSWPIDHTLLLDSHCWPLIWIIQIAGEIMKGAVSVKAHPLIVSNYEPPQPLGHNTSATCWFIFDDMSDVSLLKRPDNEPVHFYTMFPIHTNERNYEKRKGYLPLVQHWTELGLDMVIHPERPDLLGSRFQQLRRKVTGTKK